ncbi:MAG: hypothetical protein IJ660_04915 [Alphaproteobacteria bacterium]|nr:hypothetical protein [Alphaproteobacteria bacterium]
MTDELKQQMNAHAYHNSEAQYWDEQKNRSENKKQEYQKYDAEWNSRTAPLKKMSNALSEAEEQAELCAGFTTKLKPMYDAPAIYSSSVKMLDDIVKHGLSWQDIADIEAGKTPKVDLDGSQKTFFGRLKNKINNFWKPNNPKKRMEQEIAKFKIALVKDPEMLDDLAGGGYGAARLKDFKSLAQIRDVTDKYYRKTALQASLNEKEANEFAQDHHAKVQKAQNNVDAIRIELKAQARENLGITNNEQGIDALAARADAMKDMTPKQRLAFRLSQLRGTAKKQPQAKVVPMKQQQKNQTMIIKKMNEGRA